MFSHSAGDPSRSASAAFCCSVFAIRVACNCFTQQLRVPAQQVQFPITTVEGASTAGAAGSTNQTSEQEGAYNMMK
jgi:hypothetical protein